MQTFGIIGNPVSQSLSPQLHRMLYEATGFDGDYSRFHVEPERLEHVIPSMKALNIAGINVTSPYKRVIMPYLDEISSAAEKIGAVNTIHIENGLATGYNTDGYGFAKSLLNAGIEIAHKTFAVCGTSGAGKAVSDALLKYSAAAVVAVSTHPEQGMPYSELERLSDMDVIVNCTPLGMAPHEDESPVSPEVFKNFKVAVDLIYNPAETAFLRDARLMGLQTLNGLPMLVFQGIRSFKIWTGLELPPGLADKIIERLSSML